MIVERDFTIQSISSVTNETSSPGISIRYFPENGEQLIIETKNEGGFGSFPATVRLYDATGRQVAVLHDDIIHSKSVRISLAGYGLPTGMYYLHVLQNQTSVAVPFPIIE